jgi:hypothetical protein
MTGTITPADVHDLVNRDALGPALVEATGNSAWLDMRAELISGGKSNLTFTLTSAACPWP